MSIIPELCRLTRFLAVWSNHKTPSSGRSSVESMFSADKEIPKTERRLEGAELRVQFCWGGH